jgi:hypothetical protein
MTSNGQVDNRVRSQRSPDPDRTCVPPSGPNGRIRTVRRWRFPGIAVGLTSVLLFPFPTQLLAQQQNPLFNITTDRAIISQQVHLALPSAERGLQLLPSGGDSGQLAVAVESIGDTYKYLRAAQESTQQLIRLSKFPDPLMPMEIERMWQIRVHMRACTNQGGHIIKQNQEEMINMCTQHLIEGIRQLRTLLAIMP